MTTKYVSTYSGVYYELATKYSAVHISEGDGFGALVTTAPATILNYGKIGARSPAAFTFGVVLGDGGKVVNGSTQDTHATIGGYYFGVYVIAGGSVANFGTIQTGQSQSVGVIGETTLTLVNGANTDKGALINGGNGVEVKGLGTVSNFGDIYGTGSVQGYNGVWLKAGGRVTNGSTTDHSATASGYTGVSIQGALGVVVNYGTIHGLGSANNEFGVLLDGGGSLTNGSAADTSALVAGAVGVKVDGAALGSVANFGTVIGFTHQGAVLYNGGNVTNGSLGDTHASISGVLQGVGLVDYGIIRNFGAISGSGIYNGASGAQFNSGGNAFNGAATDHAATISGYTGVLMSQNGFVENFGTITGDGVDPSQAGVALENGGTVENEFAGGVAGVIQGAYGVLVLGASSNIFNRGAISGFSYAGVSVESGSVQNALATASIQGNTWGIAGRGVTTVSNLGTVLAEYGAGVYLAGGGAAYNGGGINHSAVIAGYDGIRAVNSAVLVENSGTVLGRGAAGSFGVDLLAGGVLSNGSLNNSTALIAGYSGLKMNSGVASNFGTISGQGDFNGVGVELLADANLSNG